MVLVSNLLIFRKRWHVYYSIVYMHEVEARSLFIAFHLEAINTSPQVLAFGAHTMRLQVVSNDIKSICIWHRWKWKKYTRKYNKQCSCGALSKVELTGRLAVHRAGGNLIPHVLKVQVRRGHCWKIIVCCSYGSSSCLHSLCCWPRCNRRYSSTWLFGQWCFMMRASRKSDVRDFLNNIISPNVHNDYCCKASTFLRAAEISNDLRDKLVLMVGATCECHCSCPARLTQVLLVMAYIIGNVFNYQGLQPTQMGLSRTAGMTREHFMNQFWFLNLLKDTAILEILRGLYMIKIELGLKKL